MSGRKPKVSAHRQDVRLGRPAAVMSWPRLLEIVEMASKRIQRDAKGKPDRGYQWICYCAVCCELRRLVP